MQDDDLTASGLHPLLAARWSPTAFDPALGQAVAHMTVQAQSLGLFVRQFRAFDRDAVAGGPTRRR
ncbi:hypothetical protein [Dactylosporangium sp. NPDC000521]|uniref:hypothetical protein n=1 Tax=Dactylosporangium sp. NPDC000521 TaxID=3363975 RepID=UPI0036CAEFFE